MVTKTREQQEKENAKRRQATQEKKRLQEELAKKREANRLRVQKSRAKKKAEAANKPQPPSTIPPLERMGDAKMAKTIETPEQLAKEVAEAQALAKEVEEALAMAEKALLLSELDEIPKKKVDEINDNKT